MAPGRPSSGDILGREAFGMEDFAMSKRKVGRYQQIARILRVVRMLETSRQGLTVGEIHRRLEEAFSCAVTRRTIYRDLEALEEAGFPVVEVRLDGERRWRLAEK